MIDENVAFVRPARVYNIMKEYDLVHKSNGKLERFHATLKTEHVRQIAYSRRTSLSDSSGLF